MQIKVSAHIYKHVVPTHIQKKTKEIIMENSILYLTLQTATIGSVSVHNNILYNNW